MRPVITTAPYQGAEYYRYRTHHVLTPEQSIALYGNARIGMKYKHMGAWWIIEDLRLNGLIITVHLYKLVWKEAVHGLRLARALAETVDNETENDIS